MKKLKYYTVTTVQFLRENKILLFGIALVCAFSFNSYQLVQIAERPHDISPESLKIFEDILSTPLGEHIFAGSMLGHAFIISLLIFAFFIVFLEILSIFEYFNMSEHLTPERREELYFLYLGNFDRFEYQGIAPKCELCSAPLDKLPYVKNFGFCDDCRKIQDEKNKQKNLKNQQKKLDDLKFLKENGLI